MKVIKVAIVKPSKKYKCCSYKHCITSSSHSRRLVRMMKLIPKPCLKAISIKFISIFLISTSKHEHFLSIHTGWVSPSFCWKGAFVFDLLNTDAWVRIEKVFEIEFIKVIVAVIAFITASEYVDFWVEGNLGVKHGFLKDVFVLNFRNNPLKSI